MLNSDWLVVQTVSNVVYLSGGSNRSSPTGGFANGKLEYKNTSLPSSILENTRPFTLPKLIPTTGHSDMLNVQTDPTILTCCLVYVTICNCIINSRTIFIVLYCLATLLMMTATANLFCRNVYNHKSPVIVFFVIDVIHCLFLNAFLHLQYCKKHSYSNESLVR